MIALPSILGMAPIIRLSVEDIPLTLTPPFDHCITPSKDNFWQYICVTLFVCFSQASITILAVVLIRGYPKTEKRVLSAITTYGACQLQLPSESNFCVT